MLGSVLMDRAQVGPGAHVQRSVLGIGARVGAGAVLHDAVIGDGAVVGARCELRNGMRVWPGVVLPDDGVRFSAGCLRPAPRRPAPAILDPQGPLDLRAVLAPLRRGRGDPTMRMDPTARVWRAATTPDGAATLALRREAGGTVHATGWGPGAAWALDGLPALLGADDDDSAFVSHHPMIAQARHRAPGLRFGATRRVWDVLVPGGAGAEGDRRRGSTVVARAVLALRRTGAGPRRAAAAARSGGDARDARTGSGTRRASTARRRALLAAPRWRTGWRARSTWAAEGRP